MYIYKEKEGRQFILATREVRKIPSSELPVKILFAISKKPSYAKEISKLLKEDEQKIYYHIRNLEKNGLIKITRKKDIGGSVAKIYSLTKPSFFVKFGEFEEGKKIPKENIFLDPFIREGKINSLIVVGSPDPHGPEKARARDAYYAIDLALFLGTFLHTTTDAVSLDIELRKDDLKNNLIIIGGVVTNKISKMINEKIPVRFDRKNNIHSSLSRKTYRGDDIGIIIKSKNPFDKTKHILLLAGKRQSGTKASIIAVTKKLNLLKNFSVVEGIDTDYNGVVDDAKVLETS
jgi:DNA-binding transcriptional ArsR family regulator